MNIEFEFRTPRVTRFGWGVRSELGAVAAPLGSRCILVEGSRTLQSGGVTGELVQRLSDAGVTVAERVLFREEPTVAAIDAATDRLRQLISDPAGTFVISVGGGSAMDAGKALAALLTNTHGSSVRDFLEGVGSGLQLTERPLPVVAIPTTAGTGSEATRNAVIGVDDPPCKKSLRSEHLIPAVALIDPELTVTAPPAVTAASGMDAITQLIESYVSRRATPVTRALALDGFRHAAGAIETVYRRPKDREAREKMAYAAYLSGVCLANSGLGVAHGVAAAMGAIANVPHGLACAVMLPIALKLNRKHSGTDFATLYRAAFPDFAGTEKAAVAALIEWVQRLNRTFGIPDRIRGLSIVPEQIPQLVAGAKGNSLSGNPRTIGDLELTQALETHA